jgi:hypothetical protein
MNDQSRDYFEGTTEQMVAARPTTLKRVLFLLNRRTGHAAIAEIEDEGQRFYFVKITSVENPRDQKKVGTRLAIEKNTVNRVWEN